MRVDINLNNASKIKSSKKRIEGCQGQGLSDLTVSPVSITNCSCSDNTMPRQQVVVAENDFRRQVYEMSTDSILLTL